MSFFTDYLSAAQQASSQTGVLGLTPDLIGR